MNNKIKNKLQQIPTTPGVYFFLDKEGNIIYIGKASILKRRVSSYFNKTHKDYKTPLLVNNIHDLKWIESESEVQALFMEAEFIKRHKPIYNVELKDDKNFIYIKVTLKEDYPKITLVRRPSDDSARYFGPFIESYQVKQALRYLRKIFPYYSKSVGGYSSKLEYQIGVSPRPGISKDEYRSNIRKLLLVFEGKSEYLTRQIQKDMNKASKEKKYEQAAGYRNIYLALMGLKSKIVFGKDEAFDISLDRALAGLVSTLGLKNTPKRIECYDISNFAGGDAVSSMIVFSNGLPNQKEYRHFKMKTLGPNDFAMMKETISRRFSDRNKSWPRPDLIIIDGGKGQLSSVLEVLDSNNIDIPTVGLAKRYETIIQRASMRENNSSSNNIYLSFNFDDQPPVLHLLQRIRDEAHRFAVSYHTLLRKNRTQSSELDSINGVGPATKKILIKAFGSVRAIKESKIEDLISLVGPSRAKAIAESLGVNVRAK